jgi:hypothetical protein
MGGSLNRPLFPPSSVTHRKVRLTFSLFLVPFATIFISPQSNEVPYG